MARSSYIYLASTCFGPLAAFTVKHECASWWRKRTDRASIKVERTRDGAWPAAEFTLVPETELLQGE